VLLFALTLIATTLAFIPFLWLLGTVIYRGLSTIVRAGLSFIVEEPPLPGTGDLGGIGTVLWGSLLIVGMAMAMAVPPSLSSALYIVLHEDSPLARLGRSLLDIMVEFPTIVIGISVFLVFGITLGLGLSAFTASIALAIIMMPYTTIQALEAMRIPRQAIYEAAAALGLREIHILRVMLIEGRRGIITGILVGMAKIFGETAPLLFTTTSFFSLFVPNPLYPAPAIPVLIFTYAFSPYANWQDTAWGASLMLSLIVLSIYLAVRLSMRGD